MSIQPEFSRPVRIDTLGPAPRSLSISAGPDERTALAHRFDLAGIALLDAKAELSLSGDIVTALGTLRAEVTQRCVASNLPVEAEVEESFRIMFRPQPGTGGAGEEVELSEAECDVVFYSGASIDLGEAVAETLSLSLDPYPRSAEAEAALEAAGIGETAPAGPFEALAALKDKLTR